MPSMDEEELRVPGLAFDEPDRRAVYEAMRSRRDIRRQFTGDPVPAAVLQRMLEAAHLAPSVGLSQPWNFLHVRDRAVREQIKSLAMEERMAFEDRLPAARAETFREIKIEGILESSLNICVTCDPSRGGPHLLGRHTLPETSHVFDLPGATCGSRPAPRASGSAG